MADAHTIALGEANAGDEVFQDLADARARVEDLLAAGRATVDEARTDLAEQRALLAEELGEMEDRLAAAVGRLCDAEQRFGRGSGASDASDVQVRYEMAMEDIRSLKARNHELEQRLAHASGGAASTAASLGGLDWEAEKRRLLASLEADADGCDEGEQASRRLEAEEIVRKTDEVVADRDREIHELKQLLKSQSTTHEAVAVAVGAAALGDILDKDAVIQEEREKLRQLQQDWKEKFRQAELEISVERAKLGRERAHIEERLRLLESRTPPSNTQSGPPQDDAQPKRGRWLTRLGLKDG